MYIGKGNFQLVTVYSHLIPSLCHDIYISTCALIIVFIKSLERYNPFLFTYCAVCIISTAKAPVFQHPPTPNKPFGEDPSDGRASHRSRQQQQMDQIDGVQSHEQLSK